MIGVTGESKAEATDLIRVPKDDGIVVAVYELIRGFVPGRLHHLNSR